MKSTSTLPACCTLFTLIPGFFLLCGFRATPVTLPELSTQARLIVHGTVISKTIREDPRSGLFTQVRIQLRETWKGTPPGPVVTVVHSGGILGGRKTQVSGQVDFQVGEEVIAFLDRNPQGEFVTLAMRQGKLSVISPPPARNIPGAQTQGVLHHGRYFSLPAFKSLVAPNR
ncbi:MAG: hypothetical protein FJ404_10435 [Verrucomicrobia bacterium]|nr:hypothetical protein [Verrucomicrobiota bacterium]